MELCVCACAPSRERQWQGSKSVKLLLKVFPEATFCWTVLLFVVWLFGGVCCFVLDFFLMKAAHYSLFPDVHNILSLFFPLFPSRNVFVSWKKFLLGADQMEELEIQNWGIFRTWWFSPITPQESLLQQMFLFIEQNQFLLNVKMGVLTTNKEITENRWIKNCNRCRKEGITLSCSLLAWIVF